jgi:hypothetical protein
MDERKTYQPDLTTFDQDGAIPGRDKATSSRDDAISSRDKATSSRDDYRPEPAMPPLRIDPGRARRLRADAQRPLSQNLAEGIALSHLMLRHARDTPER